MSAPVDMIPAEVREFFRVAVRYERRRQGWTQVQLGNAIGHKTDRSVVRWEQGSMPDGYNLCMLARALKVSPEALLGLEAPRG